MRFPQEFFRAEVRDGFYVSSEMKRCWAATLEVFSHVKRICDKYGIKYYADFGTLLGAVRHGGFIPWDDDFDISMKRDDYMTFLKVAPGELPEGYKVLSIFSNPDYKKYIIRVVNSVQINAEEKFLTENHGFPYVTGIDIFPLDYLEDDEEQNNIILKLIESAKSIAVRVDTAVTDINDINPAYATHILEFCKTCNYKLVPGKSISQQFYILSDQLGAIYDRTAPKLVNFYFYSQKKTHIYPREWFDNEIELPFENIRIRVPAGYVGKLRTDYGQGFMTPIMHGGMHDYPFYRAQSEDYRRTFDRDFFPKYEFNKDDVADCMQTRGESERADSKVVFLPVLAKDWKYFEKEWERCMDDPDTEVYVVPLPYFDKNETGALGPEQYDGGFFPEYVAVTDYNEFDLKVCKPDRIYIQNPYDEYDASMTVSPLFYSGKLKENTGELVYIPCFEIADFDKGEERPLSQCGTYIKVPGVVRADRIILSSEVLRDRYVDALCDFAGEDTKEIWTEKITVDESILPEKVQGLPIEEVPGEWLDILRDERGEFKNVLLYHTNVSVLIVEGNAYIEKVRRNLKIFSGSRDKLTVYWKADSATREVLEINYPWLWEEFCLVVGEFFEENLGIFDDESNYEKAVAIADAYYGDVSRLLNECRKMGKPIMIQNVEV